MKTKITQNIKSIILALILVAGVGYVSAYSTWAPPTATAPGNNADIPLNVNNVAQIKAGTLTLGGLGVSLGDFDFLPASGIPPTSGQVLMADDSNLSLGKVKWATVSGGGGSGSGGSTGTCNETPTALTSDTVYHNTTGTKLVVVASASSDGEGNGGSITGFISTNGSTWSQVAYDNTGAIANGESSITFIVPPGYYYKTTDSTIASSWQICEGGGGSSLVAPAFQAWQTMLAGTVYHATSDGFVVSYASTSGCTTLACGRPITGFTDSSSNPSTIRAVAHPEDNGSGSFTMPVKNGDYWTVSSVGGASNAGNSAQSVYWIGLK